jgi:YidC/Oxa1 family membrane protein insertase
MSQTWEYLSFILVWVVAGLDLFHGYGLNWGWSIVALTFSMRLVLAPLNVLQIRERIRLTRAQTQTSHLSQKHQTKEELSQALADLYRSYNINFWRIIWPMFIQGILFGCLLLALRWPEFQAQISTESWGFIRFLNHNLLTQPSSLILLGTLAFIQTITLKVRQSKEFEKTSLIHWIFYLLIAGLLLPLPGGFLIAILANSFWNLLQELTVYRLIW